VDTCDLPLHQVDLPVFSGSLALVFEPKEGFHTPFILLSDILQNDKINFHTFKKLSAVLLFMASILLVLMSLPSLLVRSSAMLILLFLGN